MQGLAGFLCVDGRSEQAQWHLAAMGEALRDGGPYEVGSWTDGQLSMARVHARGTQGAPQPLVSADGQWVLWMYGEVFEDGPGPGPGDESASVCLSLLTSRGLDGLRVLNGSFALVVYRPGERELTLMTDRVCTRPLFHAVAKAPVFATEAKAVAAHEAVGSRANVQSAAHLVLLQHMLGTETTYAGVRSVPAASWMTFGPAGITTKRYWQAPETGPSRNPGEAAEDLAGRLRRAVGRRCRDERRRVVLLSGGLDSRLVLAAMEGPKDAVTVTDGTYGMNRDARTARRVARELGSSWQLLRHTPDYYARVAPSASWLGDGMSPFVEAYLLGFHDALRQTGAEVAFTGHYADVLLKGCAVQASASFRERMARGMSIAQALMRRMPDELPAERVADLLFERVFVWPGRLSEAQEVLQPGVYRAAIESAREFFRAYAREHDVGPANGWEAMQRFRALNVSRHTSFQFSASLRADFLERNPILDNEVVDFAMRLPEGDKLSGDLFRRALRRLSPRAAAIPEAKSGVPPAMGRPWYEAMAWCLGKYRRVLRRLGRVRPRAAFGQGPWRDALLRRDPAMRRLVEEVCTDAAALPPDLFRPEGVKAVMGRHMRCESQHGWLLLTLLTYGLWHRRAMGGDRDG